MWLCIVMTYVHTRGHSSDKGNNMYNLSSIVSSKLNSKVLCGYSLSGNDLTELYFLEGCVRCTNIDMMKLNL